MAIREEMLNALLDCASESLGYDIIERLAKLDNNEIVGELIELLYELRDEIDLVKTPENE